MKIVKVIFEPESKDDCVEILCKQCKYDDTECPGFVSEKEVIRNDK